MREKREVEKGERSERELSRERGDDGGRESTEHSKKQVTERNRRQERVKKRGRQRGGESLRVEGEIKRE